MPSSRRAEQARLAEFLETAERLKNERAAAGAVLEVVEATPAEAWPSLAERPEFQTNAALERLSDEVRRRLDRNPREALALSELATATADALPATAYPAVTLAQIRAMAWKDRANALRFLGRYDEAFDAIARAEQVLEKHVALGLDRAVVDLVKAMTLVDVGRFHDAQTLATTCGSVFLAHGDLTRALYAGEIEAHVLYEQRQYSDAHTLYRSLLEVAAAAEDAVEQARLHNNLGYCLLHLDNFSDANIQFSNAIARFTDLGCETEITRTHRGAGLLMIAKGQVRKGLEHLQRARELFVGAAMFEEATLCGLSIVETLLSRGDNEEAAAVIDDVARQFVGARTEQRLIDAVATLQQEIAISETPVEAVRNVYAMIESTTARL